MTTEPCAGSDSFVKDLVLPLIVPARANLPSSYADKIREKYHLFIWPHRKFPTSPKIEYIYGINCRGTPK